MVPEFTCGKTILPVPQCSRGLCPSITSKTRQNYASNRGKTIGKVTMFVTEPISLPLWQTYASRTRYLHMAQSAVTNSQKQISRSQVNRAGINAEISRVASRVVVFGGSLWHQEQPSKFASGRIWFAISLMGISLSTKSLASVA